MYNSTQQHYNSTHTINLVTITHASTIETMYAHAHTPNTPLTGYSYAGRY